MRKTTVTVFVGRPFDTEALLAYLRLRAIPGVEEVTETSYRRSLRREDTAGELRVELDDAAGKGMITASCSANLDLEPEALEGLVEKLVDARAPTQHVAGHLGSDPLIGPLLRSRPGTRIPGTVDPFELSVRAILGQQISVAGATKLASLLTSGWGDEVSTGSIPFRWTFPTPETLEEAPLERIGLSRTRAGAVRELASAVAGGQLPLDENDCRKEEGSLLTIRGIGPWTASYIGLRGLHNPDAIPSADLGLRQAANCKTATELAELAEAWRPWRGYAALYLWRSFLGLTTDDRAGDSVDARAVG
jgi:AraC family transcriptional regulator of adaptative response / DNA-3-methyladenine glycosylase II